jgi:uncharacterized protein YebE (UPF0316 family)
MNLLQLIIPDSWVFTWIVLPLLIFLARIFDQSVGTLRMIYVAKGLKNMVPLLAFFESLIWLLAIGQIMQHLDNWLCYLAYAGGFATGNWVGMLLDERLSIGNVIIRIIVKERAIDLAAFLSEKKYGITVLDAEGATGKVKVIFSIVKRKDAKNVISIINEYDPHSFYTIEEVRTVNEGVFRTSRRRNLLDFHMGPKKVK